MRKEEFKKFIGSRLEESSSVEQAMQAVLESKDTSAANKRQAKKVLALLSEPEVIDPAAKQWVARYMAALEKQDHPTAASHLGRTLGRGRSR